MHATVRYDGTVRQFRLFRLHVNMATDSKYYPYDVQKPSIKLQSLDYGSDVITITSKACFNDELTLWSSIILSVVDMWVWWIGVVHRKQIKRLWILSIKYTQAKLMFSTQPRMLLYKTSRTDFLDWFMLMTNFRLMTATSMSPFQFWNRSQHENYLSNSEWFWKSYSYKIENKTSLVKNGLILSQLGIEKSWWVIIHEPWTMTHLIIKMGNFGSKWSVQQSLFKACYWIWNEAERTIFHIDTLRSDFNSDFFGTCRSYFTRSVFPNFSDPIIHGLKLWW